MKHFGMEYEMQGGGGGHKIEGEEGWDSDGGAPCLSMDEELADRQRVAERDERDQDNAKERGGQSLQYTWEFRLRGARGGNNDAGIQNLFIVKNIT